MKIDYHSKLEEYEENGFAVFENFLTPDEVESMRKEMNSIVEDMNPEKKFTLFPVNVDKEKDKYFIDSEDKISYFFETDALDNGKLLIDKKRAVSKIGHALHWWNPVYKKITYSNKVKELLKQFGYKDPAAIQGMFIFKNPEIGGEVFPHQDSTYLFTEPLSTFGIWLPLEDVTLENGCLSFIPGSHRSEIYQRFIRNPNGDPMLKYVGQVPKFDDSEYVPILVKKGDCVVIHGSVIHRSAKNTSDKPRPVYAFHVIEKKETAWSKDNWLQPTERLPFISMYSV